MSSKSPLLHAPSLAQHRFLAIMALWYLGSLTHTVLFGTDRRPLFLAAHVGLLVGTQVILQRRCLELLRAPPVPGWLRFCFGVITGLGMWFGFKLALHVLVPALLGDRESLAVLLGGPMLRLLDGLPPLLAWYGAFWGVFRLGWLDAATGLIVAGLQGIASHLLDLGVRGVHAEAPWSWASAPFAFFEGWALMFLPGAIAAFECDPAARATESPGRRLIGWIGPGVTWVIVRWATTALGLRLAS